MGPMVSEIQRDRVCKYLEAGEKEGAKAVTGGKAREGSGYFVEPTVFVDTKPGMKIVKEEIFGPVVTVTPFAEAGDALVHEANDRSEEHTSELQSQSNLVCRLLLEKKKKNTTLPDR